MTSHETEEAFDEDEQPAEASEPAPGGAQATAPQLETTLARLSQRLEELIAHSPSRARRTPRPTTGLMFGLDVESSETRVSHSLTGSRCRTSRVTPKLDPQLQVALTRLRAGMPSYALTSASDDEIPVIARVKDVSLGKT